MSTSRRCHFPPTCTDGSLVFDFSHLSSRSELDVNLLGAEDTPGAKDATQRGMAPREGVRRQGPIN